MPHHLHVRATRHVVVGDSERRRRLQRGQRFDDMDEPRAQARCLSESPSGADEPLRLIVASNPAHQRVAHPHSMTGSSPLARCGMGSKPHVMIVVQPFASCRSCRIGDDEHRVWGTARELERDASASRRAHAPGPSRYHDDHIRRHLGSESVELDGGVASSQP